MSRKMVHVVGDRFVGFAKHNPGVMTITEMESLVGRGELPPQTTLIIGQGVQSQRLRRLQERLAAMGNDAQITLMAEPRERADPRLTHKHFEKNIMISTLTRIDAAQEMYDASLLLDDECAEMSDHVTGQHIQGMVFIEAARQMFIAVTESFYLAGSDRKHYFVINKFDVSYHSFGFPIPTAIRYQVLEHQYDPRGTHSFAAKISFLQVEELVSEIIVKFAAYDESFLSAREASKARQAITKIAPQPNKQVS